MTLSQIKQEEQGLKFILKDKIFSIPSNFYLMADIKKDIYTTLITQKEYYVKSNVNEKIFQKFLNLLNKNQLPDITINNLSEFNQLSQEFGIIQDIIDIHKKYMLNSKNFSHFKRNQNLKDDIKNKAEILTKNKVKYQQIIHLLFNNKLNDSEFLKIKNELFKECYSENVHNIDLLTQKHIKNNGLFFSIDEKEKTAGIFRNLSAKGDIFIPRSITYNDQEFIITKIFDKAFVNDQNVKSIQFPENSELKIIGDYAFSFSSIENITIPSHVSEIGISAFSDCPKLKIVDFSNDHSELKSFKEQTFSNSSIQCLIIPSSVERLEMSWCSNTSNLNKILISSKNKCFINYDKFIIGKSDTNFDVLYFARRNIHTALIPSFIKQIAPYSFSGCKKLHTIEFEKNSELYLISNSAFSYTSIQCLSIPSKVLHIGSFAFSNCDKLEKVDFEENSALCSIDEFAFCENRSLHSISLPVHLKSIGECAFSGCESLKKVEFTENSELKIIGRSVFSKSSIESLSIPSSVEEIKEDWCREISDLIDIKIIESKEKNISYYKDSFILGKTDLNIANFDVILFARRNIKEAKIPSFIKIIAPYAFSDCFNLKSIEFAENSELYSIGMFSFAYSLLKKILIPPKVARIEDSSFFYCSQLKSIEFSENSKLNTICEYAFFNCPLENITIPSSFTEFKGGWCFGAPNLNNINILKCKDENISYFDDSFILGKTDKKSDIFDILLFSRRNVRKVKIPRFIKRIASYAFSECKKIECIEFESNSNLNTIENYSFAFSSIKKIFVPDKVTKIMKAAFFNCNEFRFIELSDRSQLNYIGQSAFSNSNLRSIFIPCNVLLIDKAAFSNCKYLNIVEISENSKLKIIEKRLFRDSNLDIFMVPAKLKNKLTLIA